MRLSLVWQTYFIKELLKVFSLFIGSFYFLFILIDFSTHTKSLAAASPFSIALYYLYQFSLRADILIPAALLISIIKVLVSFHIRNEIVALVTSGISLKRLMSPFLLVGLVSSLFLLFNFQFFLPHSLKKIQIFEDTHFNTHSAETPIHSITLKNNSVLLYQKFNPLTQAFFDCYWLKNSKELFRIKELYPYTASPIGHYVEQLVETETGLERVEKWDTLAIPLIQFNQQDLFSAANPIKGQSLTQLFSHLPWKDRRLGLSSLSDRQAKALTFFLYKLTFPFLCLLVIIAPAPFCLRFERTLSVYMIYAFSLFGLISFFTFVNASVIMGESQVIHPFWAVLMPPGVMFTLFGIRYAKL